jgi:hypothetical protein
MHASIAIGKPKKITELGKSQKYGYRLWRKSIRREKGDGRKGEE